jgi:hypothetical protein
MFDCTWVISRIPCYPDATLSSADRRGLEYHLKECSTCDARFMESMDVQRLLTVPGVRYSAPDRLREKVGTSLQAAGSEALGPAFEDDTAVPFLITTDLDPFRRRPARHQPLPSS